MKREDWIEFLSAAAVVVIQAYTVAPWKFQWMAKFWDKIAILCGMLASAFANMAMSARANYWTAVHDGV